MNWVDYRDFFTVIICQSSQIMVKKMDFLDHLIALAQISGKADVRCLFQGDWLVRHDAVRGSALVHMVVNGSCCLKIDGEAMPRVLHAGDVVFLPRLAGHTLSNAADSTHAAAVSSRQEGLFTLKTSGHGAPDAEIFCARFDYDARSELMTNLPDVMLLSLQDASLGAVATLLRREAEQTQVASSSALNALSEMLLVMLVRAHLLNRHESDMGILGAWHDRRLGKVVQAVLSEPESDWTVAQMTALAKVSRTQLMRLFKQQLNISPHAFVSKMRLHKAAMLLKSQQASVLNIALSCGFGSETHFGKAFKKYYGITPNQYRKQSRTENNEAHPEYVI